MKSFFFVGEKPSRTAHERGLTWRDGQLAAKTLFDALRACKIDPEACTFYNLFGDHPDDPETLNAASRLRLNVIEAAASNRIEIVAMGQKVSRVLAKANVAHRTLVHPAARGRIRGKSVYIDHVKTVLGDHHVDHRYGSRAAHREPQRRADSRIEA